MNRDPFQIGEIYHIYNRGTDKRNIFIEDNDYRRFLKSLLFFNNKSPVDLRALNDVKTEMAPPEPEEKIVEILAYCLMPNHYHLLIREKEKNGITRFMRKLGTGYTVYFNTKNDRNGVLFQGQFKSVLIDKDSYLQYIPHYIHLNSLDLVMPWRDGQVDTRKAELFLDSYKWSSYAHYIQDQSDLLLETDLIADLYDKKEYKRDLFEWLKSEDFQRIKKVTLE